MDFDRIRSNQLKEFELLYNKLPDDKKQIIDHYLNRHRINHQEKIPMYPPLNQMVLMDPWILRQSNHFKDLLQTRVSAIYGEHNFQFTGNTYTPPQSPRGGSKKIYKGKTYTIRTGPKGGKYILINSIKHYI